MNDTQDTVYQFAYDLAMLTLNPGWVYDQDNPSLPPIPVIQDQQNESAPLGPYVAIQGSPQMAPIGQPYTETLDTDGTRAILQNYSATVVLWEVNSNGHLLNTIRERSFLLSTQNWLDSQYVTLLDTTPVADVSFKLDNNWRMQARMQMTVSVASRITETVDYATSIEYTVNPTRGG